MPYRAQASRNLQPPKNWRDIARARIAKRETADIRAGYLTPEGKSTGKKRAKKAKKKPAKKKPAKKAKKKPAKKKPAKKKPAKAKKAKKAKKKPAKKGTKLQQRIEREAGNVVGKALEAGINVGVSQSSQIAQAGKQAIRRALDLGALPAGVAVAKIGAVGTAGLVAAAFSLGYGVGTAGVATWRRLAPDELLYRMALATRKTRLEWEAARGRKATKDEVQAIGKGLKEAIQRAKLLGEVPDLASAGLP